MNYMDVKTNKRRNFLLETSKGNMLSYYCQPENGGLVSNREIEEFVLKQCPTALSVIFLKD